MAGDWMKIELELPDKPEVHSIASMLNVDPDAVVGKLIRVWQWFDKHTVDGNAHGVTFALPDRITGVTGFGEAMCFVGWLEQQDKFLVMPKFDRHTSESAKKRALTAKRVQKTRNAVSVTEALPEKRREDKSINTIPLPLSKEKKITFALWLETVKAKGEKPISESKALWEYCEKVGIPEDWIQIVWLRFRERYLDDVNHNKKRYIDWRAVFLNAVKENWFKLWYLKDGKMYLTTIGQQADISTKEQA